MKVTEALLTVRETCEKILTGLKFKNGEQLSDEELKKLRTDQIVYWIGKANITDTNRAIFISVKIQNPIAAGEADEKVAFRNASAYIDIVTSKSDADPKLTGTIEKIENAFLKDGWKFEMVRPAETDTLSEKTIWSFEISKTL